MAGLTEKAEKLLDKARPPKAPKVDPIIDKRVKRGREALRPDAARRDEAIEFARKRFPDAGFRQCTPEQLVDEMSGAFRVVWSSEVIEHVFDVYAFLVACNKLLVPGGKLILTTPYHGVLKGMLIAAFAHETHYNAFGGHIRFFNKRGLARCLMHCGFTPKQWSGFGRPWPLYKSFFLVAEKTHEPLPPPAADS